MIPNHKLKPISRIKRDIVYRRKAIGRDEILMAMKHTKSNRAAARYLGVYYLTYRKYAKMFIDEETGLTLFQIHLNPSGKGINKYPAADRRTHPIEDILNGKHPDYNRLILKTRLLQGGYLPEKCSNCGYCERRVYDNHIPLIMNFIDNDINNFKLENLEMLCYNCYFLLVGPIFNPKYLYSRSRIMNAREFRDLNSGRSRMLAC